MELKDRPLKQSLELKDNFFKKTIKQSFKTRLGIKGQNFFLNSKTRLAIKGQSFKIEIVKPKRRDKVFKQKV